MGRGLPREGDLVGTTGAKFETEMQRWYDILYALDTWVIQCRRLFYPLSSVTWATSIA
jgi:hypothetical protein